VTRVLLAVVVVLVAEGLAGTAVGAQRTGPIRIGALTQSWGPTPSIVGLRDGLQELGYRENQDFVIGVRFTQGNFAQLPVAARELVRLGTDLIITSEVDAAAAKAAQMATDQSQDRQGARSHDPAVGPDKGRSGHSVS
jgi:ABC-type sugar transport system substrate-binding protein